LCGTYLERLLLSFYSQEAVWETLREIELAFSIKQL
jgi:hypothetical protein